MNLPVAFYNRILAGVAAFLLIPVWLANLAIGLRRGHPVKKLTYVDAYHRQHVIHHFRYGYCKRSLALLAVLRGRVALVGASLHEQLSNKEWSELAQTPVMPAGLIDLYSVTRRVGLCDRSHTQLIDNHARQYTLINNLVILGRAIFSQLTYSKKHLNSARSFSLFGIRIDNYSYQEAVTSITQSEELACKKGYFLNVNSINQCFENPDLVEMLNEADNVFCDGSGMRLAAQHHGYSLVANLNGTDLLPQLCKEAEERGLSIFILGGKQSVLKSAIVKLKAQYPRLIISGSHHGYFNEEESHAIVNQINRSNTDICLVALGTPIQESWIHLHASRLQCQYALGVGGLLDFVAERFSRAPRWMREIGMEWVWRLIQEPNAKFHRYVVGNPLFLYRTFILNAVERPLWDFGTRIETTK